MRPHGGCDGATSIFSSLSSVPTFLSRHLLGGAPVVGEGILTNLSLSGCSILSDRAVLVNSDVRVNALFPNQTQALSIDLGTIKWVQSYELWVEFLRLPLEARQRLDRMLRIELIEWLKIRSGRKYLPEARNRRSRSLSE
ncbi:MAG TPA: PilZ domain-containing protein [Nitrospiraceae bacterium]|nr:PilZ domain-containing protein [Nitrospiraceae bacterium]